MKPHRGNIIIEKNANKTTKPLRGEITDKINTKWKTPTVKYIYK
jgi:hypothetical protein